jgi:hypothetical protein
MQPSTLEEMQAVGLLETTPQLHLTDKGRDWLRALGDAETQEVTDVGELAADLILSTSGLVR